MTRGQEPYQVHESTRARAELACLSPDLADRIRKRLTELAEVLSAASSVYSVRNSAFPADHRFSLEGRTVEYTVDALGRVLLVRSVLRDEAPRSRPY